MWFYIFLFLISCLAIYFSGSFIIGSLIKIARFLGWKEFVVAFFLMSFAASLPNLFVGIFSVRHGIPQLSFGDIVGGNVVDLTLVIALALLFSSRKGISTESRTLQSTLNFTVAAAILPLVLVLDKSLSRIDGGLLIIFFIFYICWFFSSKGRFTKIYDGDETFIIKGFWNFLKDLAKLLLGVVFLLAAGEGIVRAVSFFADYFNASLVLIGILIVGLGNTIPETYFSIASARTGQPWMIFGNLMGSVIVPSTLVLGIVALLSPIEIADIYPFVIARFFLIISTIFFFFFVKTERRITKKEGVFLFTVYLIFVLVEIIAGRG